MTAGRIGILGGTFDPIHLGHLFIAEEAMQDASLERVIVVPAREPPHKTNGPVASAAQRLDMARLAIADNPNLEVSTMEIEREGPSYTVDTLRAMQCLYPDSELFFIVGSDALADLRGWKEPSAILEQARILAVARGGRDGTTPASVEEIVLQARGRVRLIDGPRIDISATELRDRIARGRSIRYLVPEAVIAYIAREGLYRTHTTLS